MFGYFPSYMLGNLYAAQMLATIRRELPNLDSTIQKGDLKPLLGWLQENVHQYGGMYEPQDLMKRITGEELNPAYFVRYVKEKFGAIYGI
jgi:carboxypeptidase Taq